MSGATWNQDGVIELHPELLGVASLVVGEERAGSTRDLGDDVEFRWAGSRGQASTLPA
jgi:hypothetical protein